MSLWKALTGYTGSVYDKIRIDGATNCLNFIDYEQHKIHSGNHFVVRFWVDIPINNVYDIQITTPNTTKWIHGKFWFECESETQFWVYEGVTINTPGTTITPGNRNRNSGTSSGLTVAGIANTSIVNADADTDTTGGAIVLANGIIGSGKDSSVAESGQKVILKQNEDYTVRFQANTAGYVNYQFDNYEHTDIN